MMHVVSIPVVDAVVWKDAYPIAAYTPKWSAPYGLVY